jgi:SAM-dependent methyltransferase
MGKLMINYKGVSTLEVLKEAKNYNKWIANSLVKHITTPALEIGAGTGNLTNYFLEKTPLYITDVDAGLVKNLKNKFRDSKDISVNIFDAAKKPPKEFNSFFSTVFGINVLEHIKDDRAALKNINSILKKNGKLILLVPAKKSAYTKLDRELGHFRRYEKYELIKKIQQSGYRVEKIYYFNIVGLISWYFRDKVKRKNVELKPYHIKIFDSIVPVLKQLESIVKIPVGISLIVIAKKV